VIGALDSGLRDLAWPTYDCADCIGMKPHGCQCAYYDAVAPSTAPGGWHRFLRWLHGFLFINTSCYWTDPVHGLDHV
jgi:hypothetical protein